MTDDEREARNWLGRAVGMSERDGPESDTKHRATILSLLDFRLLFDAAEASLREDQIPASRVGRLIEAGHRAARNAALEEAAALADNPYQDGVGAFGPDEPFAVGAKIAAATRALKELEGK